MVASLSIYSQMVHLAYQEGNQRETIPPVKPSFFTSSQQLQSNSFSGFIPDFAQSPERTRLAVCWAILKKATVHFMNERHKTIQTSHLGKLKVNVHKV